MNILWYEPIRIHVRRLVVLRGLKAWLCQDFLAFDHVLICPILLFYSSMFVMYMYDIESCTWVTPYSTESYVVKSECIRFIYIQVHCSSVYNVQWSQWFKKHQSGNNVDGFVLCG